MFTKETLQELFDMCQDNSLKKELSERIKNFKYVTVCQDKLIGMTLVWNNEDSIAVHYKEDEGHHVFYDKRNHRLTMLKYIDEFGTFSVHFSTEGLVSPEYTKITVKDLINLPSIGTTSITDYLSEIFDNEYIEEYKEFSNISVEKLMDYTQDPYYGKYSNGLSVIIYNNEKVALIQTGGKWTDEHTISPISENYYSMVNFLRKELFAEDNRVLMLDEELDLYESLEKMYYEGVQEYTEDKYS